MGRPNTKPPQYSTLSDRDMCFIEAAGAVGSVYIIPVFSGLMHQIKATLLLDEQSHAMCHTFTATGRVAKQLRHKTFS